ALLDHVVGLLDRDVALEVLAHDDRAHDADPAAEHRLVVLAGRVDGQVAADEDVGRFVVCHRCSSGVGQADRLWAASPWCWAVWMVSSSWADRCGLTSKVTFLTVPVNAKGLRSS